MRHNNHSLTITNNQIIPHKNLLQHFSHSSIPKVSSNLSNSEPGPCGVVKCAVLLWSAVGSYLKPLLISLSNNFLGQFHSPTPQHTLQSSLFLSHCPLFSKGILKWGFHPTPPIFLVHLQTFLKFQNYPFTILKF